MSDQLQLLPAGEGVVIPADPDGVSTGERLKAQRPDVYAIVVQALAEGMSVRAISRATGLHHCTVSAVRDGRDHGRAIDAAKQRTRMQLARFISYASERLLEEADTIPIGQLAVSMGISLDKLQLLDGAATAIVDHRHGPSHDEVNAYLEQMKAAIPVGGEETRGKRAAIESGAVRDSVDGVSTDSVTTHEGGLLDGDR